MRLVARIVIAMAFAVLPVGLAVSSCGTSAVDVDACRQIEWARCSAAPSCTPGFDVGACQRFYRDECLNGIQNASPPSSANPAMCVADIQAVVSCVGDASSDACYALIPDASCTEPDGTVSPANACNIILACPELLPDCTFVVPPPGDGGTDGDASDATTDATEPTDASDAGDASDAAEDASDAQDMDASDAGDAEAEDGGDAGDAATD